MPSNVAMLVPVVPTQRHPFSDATYKGAVAFSGLSRVVRSISYSPPSQETPSWRVEQAGCQRLLGQWAASHLEPRNGG